MVKNDSKIGSLVELKFEWIFHENSPISQKIHETTARENLEGSGLSPVSIVLKITRHLLGSMVSKDSIET